MPKLIRHSLPIASSGLEGYFKAAKGGINAAFIKIKIAFFYVKSNGKPLNYLAILSRFSGTNSPCFSYFVS